MFRLNDFSPAEWDALTRIWQGRNCRNIPNDTVARLRLTGAINHSRGFDKLSSSTERLLIERLARISRAIDRVNNL